MSESTHTEDKDRASSASRHANCQNRFKLRDISMFASIFSNFER